MACAFRATPELVDIAGTDNAVRRIVPAAFSILINATFIRMVPFVSFDGRERIVRTGVQAAIRSETPHQVRIKRRSVPPCLGFEGFVDGVIDVNVNL